MSADPLEDQAQETAPIGGYLELELPPAAGCRHPGAQPFATARRCLTAILAATRPRAVHVPMWSCEALYEPIVAASIPLRFYPIGGDLAPVRLPPVADGELFVLVNYFGRLDRLVTELAEVLGDRLVVDNSQAFFAREVPGAWSFNSARKFFGVPDGAYLYAPRPGPRLSPPSDTPAANTRFSADHLITRLGGDPEGGYPQFLHNESLLTDAEPGMSRLAERILASVDYERVIKARRRNYALLHSQLGPHNGLGADLTAAEVPMCYPFLPKGSLSREALSARRIFVPRFWRSVSDQPLEGFELERKLASRLLPLPIDQRYAGPDMDAVARAVVELQS